MTRVPNLGEVATTLRLRRHGLSRHMRVFSHSSPTERLALFQTAKLLPHGARALEIGSHLGSSALFICAGLRHCGGRLVCVDTWMNETMPDGAKDTFSEFRANTSRYADIITPVRKSSHELVESDVGRPLDLIFIDGDHSEAAVRADFRMIAAWVEVGGFMAFHDFMNPDFPGVSIVVGEALASGEWQLARLTGSLAFVKRVRP